MQSISIIQNIEQKFKAVTDSDLDHRWYKIRHYCVQLFDYKDQLVFLDDLLKEQVNMETTANDFIHRGGGFRWIDQKRPRIAYAFAILDYVAKKGEPGPAAGSTSGSILTYPGPPIDLIDLIGRRIKLDSRGRNESHKAFITEILEPIHQYIISTLRDNAASRPIDTQPVLTSMDKSKVFLVHGHDFAILKEVDQFLKELNLTPVILFEQPGMGRTIVEKLEQNSDVPFAVVILTPDDEGYSKENRSEIKSRARQNVILELGYFFGKIGRANVAVLFHESVELPSDWRGIEYISLDADGRWKNKLIVELQAAGISVAQ